MKNSENIVKYKVLVTAIDYEIDAEDLGFSLQDYWENYDKVKEEIEKFKSTLSQTLEVELECEGQDLEDCILNAVSDKTGYLVKSFTYKIEKNYKNKYLQIETDRL